MVCPGVPLWRSLVAPLGLGGQVVARVGGPQLASNTAWQGLAQGQPVGGCKTVWRAEVAIRAGDPSLSFTRESAE